VGLRFERCVACHTDPHRGAFEQQTCESCHSTTGWKQTLVATLFDHSKTKFPLLGKHQNIACSSCHRKDDFKSPIAFQTCADCHKPDPHNGQFARRADGGRCESCHTVDGFKPAKFDLLAHNKTGFPLREKHAALACAKCHIPQGRATVFKIKFAACTDCHQDTHKNQFALAPYLNHCEKCHTESGFRPSTFTLALHQQGTFVLTGSHIAIACNECHKPPANSTVAAYHFNSFACTTCHADPHRNQFAVRMSKTNSNGTVVGCEACHSTKVWSDLQRFDHGTTKFALAGAHRGVECAGCHRPPNLERKLVNVDFTAAPLQCEECHNDPHEGQFARGQNRTHCADCHNVMKWRPAPFFDHEKTIFSLKGGHQNVRCAMCHTNLRAVGGNAVLFYKPTPTSCIICHANNTVAGSGL
jgi:LSD1 subclass zinc finger protein